MSNTTCATAKFKLTIECDLCGCKLPRTKSFKVTATSKEEARAEVAPKFAAWRASLKGQNCKVCQTMIDEDARDRAAGLV